MKQAGIRVWVLTGDKVETAKTIGYSCNLLQKGMINYTVTCNTKEEVLSVLNKAYSDIEKDNLKGIKTKRGIIVNGESLSFIMMDDDLIFKVKLYF